MPNEVIAQIHWLATAAEKFDGIVFTDINGNALSDQFEDEDMNDVERNTPEDQPTENINDSNNDDGNTIMSQQSENDDNTTNKDRLPDNDAIHNQDMDVEEEEFNTEEIHEEYVEDPYEQPITIDNINIISEMNMSQLSIQLEKEQDMTNQAPTHSYNLRECPTK